MRKTTHLLTTLALVGLLCTTPFAFAGTTDVKADLATDEAAGMAGVSTDHADPTAQPENLWGWLALRFSLVAQRLSEVFGMAGQDAPATDGEVSVALGQTGVDVGGSVAGLRLDGGQVDAVEGHANGALGQAHAKVGEAKGHLPPTPALPAAPALPSRG